MAQTIDLSSDTATQPSADRVAFMMSCSLGSDQRGEDPTVNRLQNEVRAPPGNGGGDLTAKRQRGLPHLTHQPTPAPPDHRQ